MPIQSTASPQPVGAVTIDEASHMPTAGKPSMIARSRGSIIVLAALPVAAVISAGASGYARADAVPMAPHQRDRTSVDGWHLTTTVSGESIDPVPNLAGAQNSREGFVTLSAHADIAGDGGNPVTSATFEAGYQVGCQVDVSQGLQIGGTGQIAGSAYAGLPSGVQIGGTGALGGYVQTDLQPGVITTLRMATMPVVAHTAYLDMQDVHIKVDACGGPVTVRSYATLAIGTDIERTQLSVYGDPLVLA
jgi:hypothetical protein